jgi:hypothetical protein
MNWQKISDQASKKEKIAIKEPITIQQLSNLNNGYRKTRNSRPSKF